MQRATRTYLIYSLFVSLAGYLLFYMLTNWNSVITVILNLASNINAIATDVGTIIGITGTAWGVWSKFQQQDFSRKVKKQVGSRALRNGLMLLSVLLDRYTAEQVIAMVQRIDTLPSEMKQVIHDLGVLIAQDEFPVEETAPDLTPEEEGQFADEISLLLKVVGHKFDVAISKAQAAKIEEMRAKIHAKFQHPLDLLLKREESNTKRLEMELRQSQERIASLLENSKTEREI